MNGLRGFFITGTDTGIGKTWVGCGLITALRRGSHTVAGMKPVASGCVETPAGLRNEDALRLQAIASLDVPYASINPYAFAAPIAPHIAARELGVEIDFARVRVRAFELAERADYIVVEGVGGWRVPLGSDGDVAALAAVLGLPVILVVGMRLGCLNHALLSAQAIAGDGLPLAGWVANQVDPGMERLEDNLQTLEKGIRAPCLGVIPWFCEFQPERIADCLDIELLG